MLHVEVLKLQHCVGVAPHQRLHQLVHDLRHTQIGVTFCKPFLCAYCCMSSNCSIVFLVPPLQRLHVLIHGLPMSNTKSRIGLCICMFQPVLFPLYTVGSLILSLATFGVVQGMKMQSGICSCYAQCDSWAKGGAKGSGSMTCLIVLRAAHSLLVQAQVQGVLLEHSVAGAHIQHHWEDSPRVEACCCHIQVQLPCAMSISLRRLSVRK